MTDDRPALDRLAAAGFPLEALSDEQCSVLAALTEPELAVLLDLKERLDQVAPEVQAHSEVTGGALF